jgi:hypothetical protein
MLNARKCYNVHSYNYKRLLGIAKEWNKRPALFHKIKVAVSSKER